MGARHTAESFWARIAVSSESECWLWTGSRIRHPRHGYMTYGSLSFQRQYWVAHRLAWTLSCGPIPSGLKVLHRCDNPPCCNPAHLFLGTQADNMQDRKNKGRHGFYPARDKQTGRWVLGAAVPVGSERAAA